jgi:protein-disulfide isomerase
MKKTFFALILSAAATALLLTSCSTEGQVKDALKKNPKLVFDVIEENPEQFIEVVNRAAQASQKKQYEKQVSQIQEEQEKDLKNPKQPQLTPNRRLAGNNDGKIVIVEYADFQCPACKMAYDSLKEFKEKHKDQIQFYYKNMPLDFHKMAYPSALYFEGIRRQDSNKAMQFYDYVFSNQNQLDEAFLKKAAQHVGADMKKLEVAVKSEDVKKTIADDMNEFQKFGFTGTPVLIMNGVALNGAQRIEELERVLLLTQK